MILNETFFLKNLVEWKKSINFAPDLRTLNNGIMKKFIMCVIMTLVMGCAFTGCNAGSSTNSNDSIDTIMVDSVDTINVDSISTNTTVFSKC